MSLSEISVISALALPLYAYEISNNERYKFGEIGLGFRRSENQSQEKKDLPTPLNVRSTRNLTLSKTLATLEQIPEEPQQHSSLYRLLPERDLNSQAAASGSQSYKLVMLGEGATGKTALLERVSLHSSALLDKF